TRPARGAIALLTPPRPPQGGEGRGEGGCNEKCALPLATVVLRNPLTPALSPVPGARGQKWHHRHQGSTCDPLPRKGGGNRYLAAIASHLIRSLRSHRRGGEGSLLRPDHALHPIVETYLDAQMRRWR